MKMLMITVWPIILVVLLLAFVFSAYFKVKEFNIDRDNKR